MALQADYLKQMRTITECTAAIARVRDSKKVAHGGSGGGSYTKPQKQTMRDHDKKIAAALNRINGIKEVRIMANQLDFGALRSIMGTADAAPRCAAVPLGRPVTECQDLNSLDPNDPDIDDDELERDMGSDGGVGGGSGVGGGGGGGEEEEEEPETVFELECGHQFHERCGARSHAFVYSLVCAILPPSAYIAARRALGCAVLTATTAS
jgi:hypothetical protein